MRSTVAHASAHLPWTGFHSSRMHHHVSDHGIDTRVVAYRGHVIEHARSLMRITDSLFHLPVARASQRHRRSCASVRTYLLNMPARVCAQAPFASLRQLISFNSCIPAKVAFMVARGERATRFLHPPSSARVPMDARHTSSRTRAAYHRHGFDKGRALFARVPEHPCASSSPNVVPHVSSRRAILDEDRACASRDADESSRVNPHASRAPTWTQARPPARVLCTPHGEPIDMQTRGCAIHGETWESDRPNPWDASRTVVHWATFSPERIPAIE